MPAVIIGNLDFIFGIPDPLPKVPAGWTLHPDAEDFLRATGPDGLPYLITKNGLAHLIVSELPDVVKLSDVKPRKPAAVEPAPTVLVAATSKPAVPRADWSVVSDAPEDQHQLRRGGKTEFVLHGEKGRQALTRLADLFNRCAITDEETEAINDLLILF